MKRFVTILTVLLSAIVLLSMAACTSGKEKTPEAGSGGSGSGGWGGVPGVGDGEFVPDYDLDYNPHYDIPAPSPKKAEFTIASEIDAAFVKDGEETKSITLKVGDKLPEIRNRTGIEPVGWYNADDPYQFWKTEEFSAPVGGATLAPYLTMPGTDLNLGKWNDGSTVLAETRSAKGTFSLTYGRAIVGNYAGYQASFSLSEKSTKNFRFVTACEIVPHETETYHYYFVNCGAEDLTFTPWHINSGFAPAADSSCISGKTDGKANEVTLHAGEGIAFTGTATFNNENHNTIVLIDFNGKAAEGTLGFAFSRADDAEEGFEPVAPLLPLEKYGKKYSLKLPSGATFEDGTTQKMVKPGTRPKIVFEPPQGKTFAAWYEKGNGTALYAADGFKMPDRDVELAAAFRRSEGEMSLLSVGAAGGGTFKGSDGSVYRGNAEGSGFLRADDGALWYALDYDFSEEEIGAPDHRFALSLRSETDAKREYTFWLKNFGEQETTFNLFAWSASAELRELDPMQDGAARVGSGKAVTLAKGEQKEISFVFKPGEGGALRLVFEFSQGSKTGKIGFAACDLGETGKAETVYPDGIAIEEKWQGSWLASGADTLTVDGGVRLGDRGLTLLTQTGDVYTAFAGDTVYTLRFEETDGIKRLELVSENTSGQTERFYHPEGQEILPAEWDGEWLTFDPDASSHRALKVDGGVVTFDGERLVFSGEKSGEGYLLSSATEEYTLSYLDANGAGFEQLTLQPSGGEAIEFVRAENAHHFDGAYDDLGNGLHARKCTICGIHEEGSSHTFDQKNLDEKYLAAGKTCSTHDVYYYSCSKCGASSAGFTNEMFEDETSGYKEHVLVSRGAHDMRTYSENGVTVEYDNGIGVHQVCEVCGKYFTEGGDPTTLRELETQQATGSVDGLYTYTGARTVVFDPQNSNQGGEDGDSVHFEASFKASQSSKGSKWQSFARWEMDKPEHYLIFTLDFSDLADRSKIAFSAPMIGDRRNCGIWVSGDRIEWTLIGYPEEGNGKTAQSLMHTTYRRTPATVRGNSYSKDANFYEYFYSLAEYAGLIGESGCLYVRFGYQTEHLGSALSENLGATIVDRFTYYDRFEEVGAAQGTAEALPVAALAPSAEKGRFLYDRTKKMFRRETK